MNLLIMLQTKRLLGKVNITSTQLNTHNHDIIRSGGEIKLCVA